MSGTGTKHFGKTRPRRAIVVYARVASYERHWRRIAPIAGDAAGETMHRRLLDWTLEQAGAVPDTDVFLVTTGDLAAERIHAEACLPDRRVAIHVPGGRRFGEKLGRAMQDAFEAGYEQVVAIGTGTPELGADRILEAFAAIESGTETAPCAVIGPATHGGYYLLGMSRFTWSAFEEVDFRKGSTDQTVAALALTGFRTVRLPVLPDLEDQNGLLASSQRMAGDDDVDRRLRHLVDSLVESPARLAMHA